MYNPDDYPGYFIFRENDITIFRFLIENEEDIVIIEGVNNH